MSNEFTINAREYYPFSEGRLNNTLVEKALAMTRVFCKQRGETLYNTNAMAWRLVSQLLIRECYSDEPPEKFQSNAHFYDDRRIVDIDDQLTKG